MGVLLLLFAIPPSFAGTVRTTTGDTYTGSVSITTDGQLVINQPNVGLKRIKPTDILSATFSQQAQPPALSEGVVLTNGSAIAATILHADQSTLLFQRDNNKTSLPIARVARIILDPAAVPLLASIPTGQSGVLLATGDFVQGDMTSLTPQSVQLTSVLFGISHYTPGKEAVAVILSPIQPARANWVVDLADGSILMATSLKFTEGEMIATDLTQGTFIASSIGLYSYQVGPGRMTSLLNLQPAPPLDPSECLTSASLHGAHLDRAISLPADSPITYALDGKYTVFTCELGVSTTQAPMAAVDFIVLGDGVELAHATARTSIDDPVQIALPVSGVKNLTLKVQSPVGPDLGAIGIWGDPSLIR